ncbi:Serine hydroxymethyltransferase 2 [Chamberlinius hualienensis]
MTSKIAWYGNSSLSEADSEINDLINEEKTRQRNSLELIASENFVSKSVLEALGSCLTNKYSAGYPGQRSYPSNYVIDKIENLCRKRALDLFDLNPDEWGVNVQPFSGTPANLAVYFGLLKPHDRIMGLDEMDGGHSTHGTSDKRYSTTSTYFETMPYKLKPETSLIDYEMLSYTAQKFRPKVIVAGVSFYTRVLNYKRFRQIADSVGAVLMGDMAHISGLVATKLIPSPFEYCDVVTTTTHKILRGPRAGMIFYRIGVKNAADGTRYDFEDKINLAVYPQLQNGPQNHTIAALAVALREAKSEDFKMYQHQVLKNIQFLAECLRSREYDIVTGGTDVHMVVVDLKNKNIDGQKVELVCESCAINLNAIPCPGDEDVLSGIRIGSAALTSRQLKENDFETVTGFLDKAIQIALEIQNTSGNSLENFKKTMKSDSFQDKIRQLNKDVKNFVSSFPLAG